MPPILIHDSCVLLNLLASGRFNDISSSCGFRFAVVSEVAREVLYVRNVLTGEHERIELQPFVTRGLLEIFTIKGEAEQLRFIELATDLDDGEAASIAIAEARGFALATDDRKARNLLQHKGVKVETWSTFELLRHWQTRAGIPDAQLGSVLLNIANCAKFRPKQGQAEFEWWTKTVNTKEGLK